VSKSEDLDQYLGTYSSTQLPVKLTFTKNNTTLMVQAPGQSPLPLEAPAKDHFRFYQVGLELVFDTSKSEVTMNQKGKTYLFTKEK
jgi:D-alanyl-D-alanine carboxypeptidase